MPRALLPRRVFVGLPLLAAAGATLRANASELDAPEFELGRLWFDGARSGATTRRGEPVELTLDAHLSDAAGRLLEHARPLEGAAIALDPRTGRVLAWAERRSGGAPGSVLTSARSPAASLFKLVTTAALFEAGGVHPADRVCISGGLRRVERGHLESPRSGDVSCAPFAEALGHSRNAVYAQLATRHLLRGDLLRTAERIGFNSDVPFDWPVPIGQLVVPYNDLEFARTAAGFQGSTLSPLGGAYLASVIAQGGLAQRLRVVRRAPGFEAPDEPQVVRRAMEATTAWRLTRMMEVTVHSGTCRPSFADESGRALLPNLRVAGKTGTLRPESDPTTTSWFIGFAPSRRPEIAVSVLLRNGRVWHQRAAEVARDLLRCYFHERGARGVVNPLVSLP